MTDSLIKLRAGELPHDLLESKWDCIAKSASQIADEIDIKSEGLSGNFRKQTVFISNFFRDGGDYQRALNQAGVLSIANPLAQLAEDNELSQSDVSTAVHIGLCTLSRHGSNHRTLFRLFLYPILLTYFVALGLIFASHFVLLPFEQMYAEFGILLPRLTSIVLGIGYLARLYTVTILMIIFGLPPLFWFLNWVGQEKREPGMSRLDLLLARKRPTAARWMLHASLLLEAGLPKDQALEKASMQSGERWLKRRNAIYSGRLAGEAQSSEIKFFNQPKFSMADTAIAAPRSRGQVVLLQQIATWYRDSSSNIIEWVVQLLVAFYAFAIILFIIALVLSLFMPLFAIISGLTGGGPGGFM